MLFRAGSSRHPALVLIGVALLLDALALGMVRPVLPGLVRTLSAEDAVTAARLFGLAETGWALIQCLVAPFLGVLSDRTGRRPVILLSNLALAFAYVLMAAAPGVTLLLAGRVLSGVAVGTFCAAGAAIADLSPPGTRAAGFGVLGAAIGVGFGLGPMLGGVLGGIDPRLPIWVAAGLVLANVGWAFLVVPETLPPGRRRPISWRNAHPLGALRLLCGRPGLSRLSVIALIAFIALEVMPVAFVLFAQHRFGWPPAAVGLTLGSVGIGIGLVQAGLVSPAIRRFGERGALSAGLAAGAAGLAALGLAPGPLWIVACVPVIALWGIFVPTVQSLMTRHVSETEQGLLQGALGGLHHLSKLIAPILFTTLFAASIAPGQPASLAGAPFLLAAAMVLVALVLARFALAPRRGADQPALSGPDLTGSGR
mgnify:FL=1